MKKNFRTAIIPLLFISLLLLFTRTGIIGWGDMARLATVESLVERNTFVIDDSTFIKTGDKVRIAGNYYGAQLPLLPFLSAGAYSVLHRFFRLSFSGNLPLTYYLMSLLVSGIPAVVMLTYFFHSLAGFNLASGRRLWLTAALSWGTLIFVYSVHYNSQMPAAAFLFFAFYLMIRARSVPPDFRRKLFFCGFWIALSAALDPIPGGVFGVIFFLALFFDRRLRGGVAPYILGCLPPLILYAILNLVVSGSVLPLNLHPDYPLALGVHRHPDAAALVKYSFHSLVGIRGWLTYSPLLIMAAVGLATTALTPEHPLRAVAIMTGLGLVGSGFCILLVTENYGGWCFGTRYFIPLTPPLFFFIGGVFEKNRRWARILFYPLFIYSILVGLVGLARPGTDCSAGDFTLVNNLKFIGSLNSRRLIDACFPILRADRYVKNKNEIS